MRLVLLLPVLFSVAAPAYAEGARESRYGPSTPRQAPVAAAARYDGPMLSWANKRQPSTEAAAPATSAAPAQPAPLAAWAGYSTPPPPVAYTQAPAPVAAAPPAAPPRRTAAALPTSLYAAPRPAPVAAATPGPAKDWSGYRSPRMATAAPAPAPAPPPAAPAPPPPRQVAAANTGVAGARFYSVARESGLTPDPIPPAGPDHQVLITTDAPPPQAQDATPMHGSADWLAAGARGGDDDDDSATRRAKTRNEGL
ncbi:hypothetical protein [Caulobacter sp. UNC279MFTsu5.1]|uniref:hypothetical protein n=1 Tax=Caulobacter sp. UNC279MFTsu5.1 TaxID=1502775 RepID=UPI0008E8BCF7|nr:hypothetical protein [Caulobacter sp. UNC279MFTsu5.1]SFJ07028.1 Meckel syndrome type 1 protein [Caulobacter sp. UNC279MFTsu5.1]